MDGWNTDSLSFWDNFVLFSGATVDGGNPAPPGMYKAL